MRLPARSPAFLALARPYVRNKLASGLDGVWVAGLESLVAHNREAPLVLAATHVSVWDPLVVVALEERLEHALAGLASPHGHALMDRDNLGRLPFFGMVGALPLDRKDRVRGRADLEAARDVITRPGQRLWIFPQGRQRPPHLRPLALKPGVLALAAGAPVVPVGLSYAFGEREGPACFVAFGPPIARLETLDVLEAAMMEALARCDRGAERAGARHADEGPAREGFEALVSPSRGGAGEDLASQALAAMARRFEHVARWTGRSGRDA
jgi:1-acyl-sn-glycerol-3-phosphate acyltransferase